SLRSLEMYANWIRHIYIVTDNQVPHWLDTSHPRITIIDHTEVFADSTVLPVYNSHAIESQLHHIPELSEHYLYMNDDVFFGRPTSPDQFLLSNGVAKFFPSIKPLDFEDITISDTPVMTAANNGREFTANVFHRTVSR